jgi:hypothetical protein
LSEEIVVRDILSEACTAIVHPMPYALIPKGAGVPGRDEL